MKEMKAIQIHSFGGPDVLIYEDTTIPSIQDDEVLIRVHAAGVNPVDWKVREGYLGDLFHYTMPVILGWDVSGTIVKTGSLATSFQEGDQVFGHTDISRNGAYAEYVAVKSNALSYKPESLNHIQAAAVPLAALTAWQSIFDHAELRNGQKILIHGAAGGVGHFAVQFARWRGAHVIGTASGKNSGFLRQLGAHDVIDYTTTHFEDVLNDIDVVFDTLSGATREKSWKILKEGGVLVTTLPPEPSPEITAKYKVRAESVFVQPNSKELAKITLLIDSGHVLPEIHAVFSLAEARKAHELSQTGHVRGKIVLEVIP